jgi:hypothetical protein
MFKRIVQTVSAYFIGDGTDEVFFDGISMEKLLVPLLLELGYIQRLIEDMHKNEIKTPLHIVEASRKITMRASEEYLRDKFQQFMRREAEELAEELNSYNKLMFEYQMNYLMELED